MELLTAAQMRAIEQAAIDSGEVTGLELMERAGRGVVEAIFEEWPELRATSHRAVVLCGPGNNGGDGFVVARLLKEWGWEVEVFLYGDPDKLPPDARVNYERWGALGKVNEFERMFYRPINVDIPDLYVDALFGTGLKRPVELGDDYAGTAANEKDSGVRGNLRHVAIDMPSGVCSDSGKLLGDPFIADLTVTFHGAKYGHLLEYGPALSRKISIKDIGISLGTGLKEAFGEPSIY
ncbi:MAG: NAD(P)H-hydrate epimerase, partial [Pseudomonadota bacterium]